jgi:hypothetical protein
MGWFGRKPKPEACRLGEQAVGKMMDDLGAFLNARFTSYRDKYLTVLEHKLEKTLNPNDAPPLIAAGIELQIFAENVDNARPRMIAETSAAMREWIDFSDQVGAELGAMFRKAIENAVDDIQHELTDAGMKMFIDKTEVLKIADDQWRITNPELSAKFPAHAKRRDSVTR